MGVKLYNDNVPVGLYRHFKGRYFYVSNVVKSCDDSSLEVLYFDVCRPEGGLYSRPVHEFLSTTDKQEKDDYGNWFESGKDIKDRKDNVTGQPHRFEIVEDLNFQLWSVSTEQLIEELRSRTDSPIHELDIEGLRSDIFSIDYVVGKKFETMDDFFPSGVDTINAFSTEEEAKEYFRSQVAKDRIGVFKRVFIECK